MLWKDLTVEQIRELKPEELKEYNQWARRLIKRRIKTFPEESFQRSVLEQELKFAATDSDYSKALNYHYVINQKDTTYTQYKRNMRKEYERIQHDEYMKRRWGGKLWNEETFLEYIGIMIWAKSIYNSSDLDSERIRKYYIDNYDEIHGKVYTKSGRNYLEELFDAEFGFRKL